MEGFDAQDSISRCVIQSCKLCLPAGNCVQWSNCAAGLVCYLPQDGDIRQKPRPED